MGLDEGSGHLLLLMAPSGSGKKSLVDSVLATHRDIYFAKTFTTRSIREGVEENPLYCFVSKEMFLNMVEQEEFAEWAEYSGNLYGTPKSEIITPLKQGLVVFKEMELQGVLQLQKQVSKDKRTVVYVDGGPWETLKERIIGRAPISEVELEGRRKRYEEESKAQGEADIIIKNYTGGLATAKSEMEEIVHRLVDEVHNK